MLKTNFSFGGWKGDFLGCRKRVLVAYHHNVFSPQISSVESLGAFVPFLTPDIPSQNILVKMSV